MELNIVRYDPVETGKRIRKLRATKKMNQYDLAEELSISHSHVCKIETGKRSAGIDTYLNMADFFGVSLEYLFEGRSNNVAKEKIRMAIETLEEVEKGL